MRKRAILIWIIVVAGIAATVTVVVLHALRSRPAFTTIQGAVIRSDADARKQLPLAGVSIIATRNEKAYTAQSDGSGYFKIVFPDVLWPGQVVDLNFQQGDYRQLDLNLKMEYRSTVRQLIVVAMEPLSVQTSSDSSTPASVVSNIRIRYTVNREEAQNIGSAVRTFQVTNQGNVPCRHQSPCSPDGVWKASSGSVTLDAGVGNEFRNVRASCIAGPCPFTRISPEGFNESGRTVVATAEDWSDTATFLLEAEVFRTSIDSGVRSSYPVVYGRTLNFTLPPTQEGVSIEADIDGTPMVFPLGPDLSLSWAVCASRTEKQGDHSTVYQCELKPGYRF